MTYRWGEKKAKQEPRQAFHVDADDRLMAWLESVFGEAGPEDERSWPSKIVLRAAYGNGKRYGAIIKTFVQPERGKKPEREQLVTMCNELFALAQAECDAVDRRMTFAALALDPLRSDAPYGRCLITLRPSGTVATAEDEAGDDEDEGGTKLLRELLESERRDKRYTLELAMNVISGAMERDSARIERMEQIVEGTWKKQVELMAATETMLSAASERQLAQEWSRLKVKAVEDGLSMVKGILPGLISAATQGKNAILDGLRSFIQGLTEQQILTLFGSETQAGILRREQSELLAAIVRGEASPDRVVEFTSTLEPGQILQAQTILDRGQVASLMLVLDLANKRATNGAANGAS